MKLITSSWDCNINDLIYDLQYADFNNFLHWDVIKRTMFIGNSPYLAKELLYLITHNWKMWKYGIKENSIGNPTPFILYKRSSGNLIHHAYHLAKFMNITKQNVLKYDTIFEFGGGYGSMARLFHNIGFDGKYIIYDLPQFLILQQKYLKNIKKDNNVVYISDIDNIPNLKGRTLFIGTWSLSEAPIQLRNDIFTKINADSYLISYLKSFEGMDNYKYFNSIIQQKNTIKWYNNTINHIPGNHYYLFGTEHINKEVEYYKRHK